MPPPDSVQLYSTASKTPTLTLANVAFRRVGTAACEAVARKRRTARAFSQAEARPPSQTEVQTLSSVELQTLLLMEMYTFLPEEIQPRPAGAGGGSKTMQALAPGIG